MSAYSADRIFKKLKRVAKRWRSQNPSWAQAQALDAVASVFGYNNWSLLSKNVNQMSQDHLSVFHDTLYAHPVVAVYLPATSFTALAVPASPVFDRAAAVEEMTEWVESNYTPLNDFAFYDGESENGFSVASADLVEELQDEFSDRFPLSLIEDVARDLEDRGPWGDEDFGYD